MRKKLGSLFWGSQELKLFEPVVVEFMLRELEFHTPPGSKPVPTIFTNGIRLGMKTSVSDQRWRPCTY